VTNEAAGLAAVN